MRKIILFVPKLIIFVLWFVILMIGLILIFCVMSLILPIAGDIYNKKPSDYNWLHKTLIQKHIFNILNKFIDNAGAFEEKYIGWFSLFPDLPNTNNCL